MKTDAEKAYGAFRKRAGGMVWAELPEADRADWEAVASALQCTEPANATAVVETGAFIDHDLKIDPERFVEVLAGTKTHEIRVFDRDYQVGNTLRLNAYDRSAKMYTGRSAMARVTNITAPGSYGLPENVGVMSIALTTTCIDILLSLHPWALQSWNDRYGKGVWIAIAPNDYVLDRVRDATSAGDLDMETATNFLLDSKILPIAVGRTFGEALTALESRLAALPIDQLAKKSPWVSVVSSEYDYINEELDSGHGYGDLRLRAPSTAF